MPSRHRSRARCCRWPGQRPSPPTAIDTDNLAEVARAAASGAAEALAKTPDQLAALARAGVVDAGGRGLVVLLDALVEVVTGEASEHPLEPMQRPASTVRESGSAEFAFEVQFLLDAHGSRGRRN